MLESSLYTRIRKDGFLGLVASGWLAKSEGGMFQPAGLAGHTVGDGKGPSSNQSEFFAMRCTLSTIYHMM